ncbi:MAG TPA: homoserine dehydrogenase [Thermoguttaceae bacterium]|nr:homoserine dehydrogenase [Thermoguttaceae bacterium]
MDKVKVALVGFGTIGSGTARLLLEEGPRVARAARRKIELAYVVDTDLTRKRNVTLPKGLLSNDYDRVLADPEVKVVIELVGGTVEAKTIILRALESGKDVVTANKALLATHGPALFQRARELGRTIAFEASVGGGIPLIAAIGQSLATDRIELIEAILNGTCNFILTQMAEHGLEYADVVAEAQRLGYAEADPTLDVNGSDTTQKLAILAQLAFGAAVDWKEIPRTGIDRLTPADIHSAEQMGYAVRLVATARRGTYGLELFVSPTLVPYGSQLAGVEGAFNGIRIVGEPIGPIFLQGYGAGQRPTSSAVVSDVIDTASGRTAITFAAQGLWSGEGVENVSVRDPGEIPGRFYLRFDVKSQLDAVAEVTRVLKEHGASVDTLVRYDDEADSRRAALVIVTGETAEGNMKAAVKQIEKLPFVRGEAVRCRVGE